MPQMAPISWLFLFITFSIILITFNAMNYFSFLPKSPEMTQKSIKQNPMNWKW
uniref:ATP synthase complex subunit 8 n=1 Tax=Neuroperla schedingi TaxID=466754 RepID=A0A482JNE8_9NEOP|nr:ATP synthase F0 subunit 8 [Neuroperla schedingi]QBP33899.1 ATP synthase F0 subunit 8 [Neuroperla schedingi]